MAQPSAAEVWTVGHSSLPIDSFLGTLELHHLDAVADVRSWPRSRFAPWFDESSLSNALDARGVGYVWLGDALGGRPSDSALYLPDGRVRYDAVAATPAFRDGLVRLRRGLSKMRVALLCAEEDPTHCHRRLLVARVLYSDGVVVRHIRRDGTIEDETGFMSNASLFGEEELPWTSSASVSRGRRRSTSSAA